MCTACRLMSSRFVREVMLGPLWGGITVGVSLLIWIAGLFLAVVAGLWCCFQCYHPVLSHIASELLGTLQHAVGSAVEGAMAKSAKQTVTDFGMSGASAVMTQLLPVQWRPLVTASVASLRAWSAGSDSSYLTDVRQFMFN